MAKSGSSANRDHSAFAIYHSALVVAAAVAVYLPALRNGFIWDDPLVLQQLRAIHSVHDLFVLPAVIPHFYFRPIVFLSYLVDRSLGGEAPFWFHASVIATHALNALLVFLLAGRLFPSAWYIPAAGALLFAVFPTHVESVAWMAGRSDVIVCAFVLASMLVFMERDRYWSSWLGGIIYLLALLAKETAIGCLILVPLLDVAQTRRLQWTRYVPLLVFTGLYFVLRKQALGFWLGGGSTSVSFPALIGQAIDAMGFYALQAVAPLSLCAYIPEVPSGVGYVVAGVAALAVGAGGAAVILRALLDVTHSSTEKRSGLTSPAFFVAWFFALLIPSLTVIFRRSASAVVADRYLYLPSVASCILFAWGIQRIADWCRRTWQWSAAAVAIVSAVFATQAVRYTRVWADDLSFWTDVAAKVPNDALPQQELGTALLERGRLPEAEQALQRALASKADADGRAMAYNNLGNIYRRQGRHADAEHAFEQGLQSRAHPTLYHNLGMTLIGKIEEEQRAGDRTAVARDLVKAREAFEHALALGNVPSAGQAFPQWDAAKTHALLGQVLFSLGDRTAGREQLDAALRLEPNGPAAEVTRRYLQQVEK